MEKFNRAERRRQVARLKDKRKHYWGYGGRKEFGRTEMDAKQLARVVQHPQICSCWMCGNDRNLYGRTLKEILQMIDLEEYEKKAE